MRIRNWLGLIILLTLVIIPFTLSNAQSDYAFTYEDNEDGSITITGYDGVYLDEDLQGQSVFETVVVPAEIDGKPVTAYDSRAFMYCAGLKRIVFPEGLKKIGWRAFFRCYELEEAWLPSTIEQIADDAFNTDGDVLLMAQRSKGAEEHDRYYSWIPIEWVESSEWMAATQAWAGGIWQTGSTEKAAPPLTEPTEERGNGPIPAGLWYGLVQYGQVSYEATLYLAAGNRGVLNFIVNDNEKGACLQPYTDGVTLFFAENGVRIYSHAGKPLSSEYLKVAGGSSEQILYAWKLSGQNLVLALGDGRPELTLSLLDGQSRSERMASLEAMAPTAMKNLSLAYYQREDIKCVGAWMFTADAWTQLFPLYVDRNRYDVSILIPDEAAGWLSNPIKNGEKESYIKEPDLAMGSSTISTGAFRLAVEENKDDTPRDTLVYILGTPKNEGDTPISKALYVKQLPFPKEDDDANRIKDKLAIVDPATGYANQMRGASNTWLWPVPSNRKVGQLYGRYYSLKAFHPALDISPKNKGEQEAIVAAADGVVVSVRHKGVNDGTACELTLRHIIGNDVFYTKYLHMATGTIPSELRKVGAVVRKGQLVGMTGDTVKADGVHLHFSIFLEVGNANKTDGRPDPMKAEKPKKLFPLDSRPIIGNEVAWQNYFKNVTYVEEGIVYTFDYAN